LTAVVSLAVGNVYRNTKAITNEHIFRSNALVARIKMAIDDKLRCPLIRELDLVDHRIADHRSTHILAFRLAVFTEVVTNCVMIMIIGR